jgi:hypothetical protein
VVPFVSFSCFFFRSSSRHKTFAGNPFSLLACIQNRRVKIVCQLGSVRLCVHGILNNLESENKKNEKKRRKRTKSRVRYVIFIRNIHLSLSTSIACF